MNEQSDKMLKHDLLLKSRERLEVSGVSDVTSFDDTSIVVEVTGFGLTIEGENLKIEKFNAESGEFVLNGKINGLFYFNHSPQKKKKAFSDIFK